MKNSKKVLAVLLVAMMLFSLTACIGGTSGEDVDWKIGVITGTVAQNEEEYRAAQNVQAKYGEEHVVLQTYPDKFMDEQETVIANVVGVASDPAVKALVICQAVPGMSAAIDKVKETRDDLLIIAGVPGEDPAMISERADIILAADEIAMGRTVIEQAKSQGAETFVHYSFPRHMTYATLSTRRELFKETCEELGLEFVDATMPDPTGDAGVPGTQQFILEDVPKMIDKYGVDTAFFSTNCSAQEPLIKSVLEEGGIYPQPCCPSPTHGFPTALGLEISEDQKGDMEYIMEVTKEAIAEAGGEGRFSTWPVPVNMMFVEAGADYAAAFAKGEITDKQDYAKMKEFCDAYAGVETQFTAYKEGDTVIENYQFVLIDFVNY